MVVDRTQLIHPTKRLDQILLARNEFVYTLRSISVAHTGTRHGDDDLHGRLRRNPMSAARSPSICRILPASTSSIHFHVLRLSKCAIVSTRRRVLELMAGLVVLAPIPAFAAASRSDFADMPALRGKDYGKSKMRYPDYVETGSGLQYKDLKVGIGAQAKPGDVVVVDWDGYTIGYYGRIFEARNKTKGGSFEGGDKDFFKFKLGSHEVIPAFEEAVPGMAPGGIRRIIVPPDLGYPDNDSSKSGPKPTTFSGQRALDFVLRNQGLIDKTLLFDVELLKILPS